MNTITTTLTTIAQFSDDMTKRYLLRKEWNTDLPSLAIIMLAPSQASGIELDNTTMLVINNASRLGYGSVSIVNLFSTLDNSWNSVLNDRDEENIKIISDVASSADTIVYAAGVGKATNKTFIQRKHDVLNAIKIHEDKLMCLSDKDGNSRFQHPLSPSVRTWYLSPMRVSELTEVSIVPSESVGKKRGRPHKQ